MPWEIAGEGKGKIVGDGAGEEVAARSLGLGWLRGGAQMCPWGLGVRELVCPVGDQGLT